MDQLESTSHQNMHEAVYSNMLEILVNKNSNLKNDALVNIIVSERYLVEITLRKKKAVSNELFSVKYFSKISADF